VLERLLDEGLGRLLVAGNMPVDEMGQTPLHDAVLNLKFGCVEALINLQGRKSGPAWQYAFMNARDSEYEMTALHHIVQHCSKEICTNTDQTDSDADDLVRMAEMMMDNGADVTQVDATGYSPLHFVVPNAEWMEALAPGSIFPLERARKLALLARKIINKGAVVDAKCQDRCSATAHLLCRLASATSSYSTSSCTVAVKGLLDW